MSQVADLKDAKSSAESRGKRLKSLRMMTGLSRKALEEQYGISASTIQSWEDAKAGGLTEKGAKRVITVFKKEGVRCSIDWLLFGIGFPPQLSNKLFDESESGEAGSHHTPTIGLETPSEDRAIVNELLVFRQNNPDAVEYIVADNGMSPSFTEGDYIAGKRRLGNHIDSVVGMDCVIETQDNEILFRRLKRGQKAGTYNLICTNIDTTVKHPVLYDRELLSAAPVIWHRRKDSSIR